MSNSGPILLIPGLGGSPRGYGEIIPPLWRHGGVQIANQLRETNMDAMAARILAEAPPSFSLIGHSMGGYIAFAILRAARERVMRLALLNTSARPDTPEATARRREQMEELRKGRFEAMASAQFPLLVHPSRAEDAALREMNRRCREDSGPEAWLRQQEAILSRPDSRPMLADIGIPTLVLSGDADQMIPNDYSREMAEMIPGAVLSIVPQAGHLAHAEQPAHVIAELERWLASG